MLVMEISGCWNLHFYTFLIFLMSTQKTCCRNKKNIWSINQKQTCQDVNNGWCWAVEIRILVTFFFLLFCIFFLISRGGKRLRNCVCVVFLNAVHSLLMDDQCCARHQARWKERPLCSPPGDWALSVCLSVCLGGVGIQGRITLPHRVHLSWALKINGVEGSEVRVGGMERRVGAGWELPELGACAGQWLLGKLRRLRTALNSTQGARCLVKWQLQTTGGRSKIEMQDPRVYRARSTTEGPKL